MLEELQFWKMDFVQCFLGYMYWQKMGFGSFQVKLVARLTNKVFLIINKMAKRDKSLSSQVSAHRMGGLDHSVLYWEYCFGPKLLVLMITVMVLPTTNITKTFIIATNLLKLITKMLTREGWARRRAGAWRWCCPSPASSSPASWPGSWGW